MTNSFVGSIEEHDTFSDESFGVKPRQKFFPVGTHSPIRIWIKLKATVFIYCCQFYVDIRLYCYGEHWANQNENPKRLIPTEVTCEASVCSGR